MTSQLNPEPDWILLVHQLPARPANLRVRIWRKLQKPGAGAIKNSEFTHQGDDCTFETMRKRFGLTHIRGLQDLAEIVHDIDLKDEKLARLEAPGLNAIIDGLSETLRDDRKLLQQASYIFDALFTLFGKQADKTERGRNRTKKAKRSPKK